MEIDFFIRTLKLIDTSNLIYKRTSKVSITIWIINVCVTIKTLWQLFIGVEFIAETLQKNLVLIVKNTYPIISIFHYYIFQPMNWSTGLIWTILLFMDIINQLLECFFYIDVRSGRGFYATHVFVLRTQVLCFLLSYLSFARIVLYSVQLVTNQHYANILIRWLK